MPTKGKTMGAVPFRTGNKTMMEARGNATNMQTMAERWEGWRAETVRVAVLALLLALGSLLLNASPALAATVSFAGPTNFAVGDFPPDDSPSIGTCQSSPDGKICSDEAESEEAL